MGDGAAIVRSENCFFAVIFRLAQTPSENRGNFTRGDIHRRGYGVPIIGCSASMSDTADTSNVSGQNLRACGALEGGGYYGQLFGHEDQAEPKFHTADWRTPKSRV